jgi:hypothetical protein
MEPPRGQTKPIIVMHMTILIFVLRMIVVGVLYPLANLGTALPITILIVLLGAEIWRSRHRSVPITLSLCIWYGVSICYLLPFVALVLHEFVVHDTTGSMSLRSIDTLIVLLSSGLCETFGLPGSFQIAFTAPNAPALIFAYPTILIGAAVGVLGIIGVLKAPRIGSLGVLFALLSLEVFVLAILDTYFDIDRLGTMLSLEYLLVSSLLLVSALNIRRSLEAQVAE